MGEKIKVNYDAMKYFGAHSTADYPKLKKIADSKAAQIFGQLDRADGVEDGKVSSNIWNAYASEHGGNLIKDGHEIDIMDGINSITTYEVREQNEKARLASARVVETPQGPVAIDKDGKVIADAGIRQTSHGYIINGQYGNQVRLEND